jgi:hypothetical protein
MIAIGYVDIHKKDFWIINQVLSAHKSTKFFSNTKIVHGVRTKKSTQSRSRETKDSPSLKLNNHPYHGNILD